MKNFATILVFIFIVGSVSAQKKSSSHRYNSHKRSSSPSMVHTTSSHKSSSTNHKPTRSNASPSISGGNTSASKTMRTDIKPSAVPTAASSQTNTTPDISREDLVSDGTDIGAVAIPESPETTNQTEINYNYKFAFCNTHSYQTLRCNRRWYRYWYRYKAFDCTWTGDITFVNTTDITLVLYVEQRDAESLPTLDLSAMPSLANRQNYNNLEILPGDSLTFKMPCGGLVYEVVQKHDRRNPGKARRTSGWLRSISGDLRVAIKEEELE